MKQVRVFRPRCLRNVQSNLATLYAQSRPAMLSRRCITATAGTSLVRDSQTVASHYPTTREAPTGALTRMLVQTFVH